MSELHLTEGQLRRLEEIYQGLEEEYLRVADELQFSCQGCPDNCCDSYFLHHTYSEWLYLFAGFMALPEEKREEILRRAEEYREACRRAEAEGRRPQAMCPLNEGGLCILYRHRLLVCRTHGVPARMVRPDGQAMEFPGCFRCQEIVSGRAQGEKPPRVERTPWLQKLAQLEGEVLQGKRHLLPKMRKTIAEMLLQGPPALPTPFCRRHEALGGEDINRKNMG